MSPYREHRREVTLEELARTTQVPPPAVVAHRGLITAVSMLLPISALATVALLTRPHTESRRSERADDEEPPPAAPLPSLPWKGSELELAAPSLWKDFACRETLALHCGEACPSLASASARAARGLEAGARCEGGGVTMGTCGAFRFVSTAGGYGGTTEYFDASGRMIAAQESTDFAAYCYQRSSQIDFGAVPSCTAHVERTLCMPSAKNLATKCQQGDPLCAAID